MMELLDERPSQAGAHLKALKLQIHLFYGINKYRPIFVKYYICIISVATIISLSGCTSKDSGTQQEADQPSASELENTTSQPKPVEEVTIRATGNSLTEMAYDLDEISVAEGSRVKITLINQAQDSAMIHNIVFVYEGTRNATAMAGLKAGPEQEYVPDLPTVFAASSLAQPGETVVLEFDAPEAGSYYFICTYPGHWERMTGIFTVTEAVG